MKTSSKVALTMGIIFSLLVISGAVLMAAETSDDIIEISKKLFHLEFYHYNYDCAASYDGMVEFAESNKENPNPKEYDSLRDEFLKLSITHSENRCAITVMSWANEAKYEGHIWASNWEKASWHNQLILGEVEPIDRVQRNMIEQYKSEKQRLGF